MDRRLAALLLLGLPAMAAAQPASVSPGPDAVAVTIYRDPNRSADSRMELRWLNGYALISETRRVNIPLGEADIRFEGVAGGIIPESAIVTGLPDGVAEKNQDAYLLSPASLLDRSLGKRVHLRRTTLATGEAREHEAVIRSGADGAVVLQTEEGFEALRCTGINEAIVYDGIPAGLSAKPTLSVRTRSQRSGFAAITLSYLATGFDWQANYIANLNPAGDRVDLFAWVTLANGDETSFVRASTQTVAGRPNRESGPPRMGDGGSALQLRCWPAGTTSDIPLQAGRDGYPPPPPPPAMMMEAGEAIVVTGSRVAMKAGQEDLGDLKLYRIPEPVTVAANSQKQVAMLEKRGVKVDQVFRTSVYSGGNDGFLQTARILKTRNRTAEGLGLPLPAGAVVLFAAGRERPILLGEGSVGDRAVGEDVEIELGVATGITARLTRIGTNGKEGEFELVVTNDHDRPIAYEADFADIVASDDKKLRRRNGRPFWTVTVPANGKVSIRYRLVPA